MKSEVPQAHFLNSNRASSSSCTELTPNTGKSQLTKLVLNFEKRPFYYLLMCLKTAGRLTKSTDLDHLMITILQHLIWVFTDYTDLSFSITTVKSITQSNSSMFVECEITVNKRDIDISIKTASSKLRGTNR